MFLRSNRRKLANRSRDSDFIYVDVIKQRGLEEKYATSTCLPDIRSVGVKWEMLEHTTTL